MNSNKSESVSLMTDSFDFPKQPTELGLPKKFTGWRPGQAELVDEIVRSNNFLYLLDSPPGMGKSLVGIAAYKRLTQIDKIVNTMQERTERYRCIYVTRTKQLQQQILNDFPEARTMMGRANFRCNMRASEFPDFTADDCPGSSQCPAKGECHYLVAKQLAILSPLVVLNYDYFLTEANGPGQFSGANMIILDEVDTLENALFNAVQLTLSERQLVRFNLKPPQRDGLISDKYADWHDWCSTAQRKLFERAQTAQAALVDVDVAAWTDIEIQQHRGAKAANALSEKLQSFIEESNESWIVNLDLERKRGWQIEFKPVMVASFTNQYLWQHGTRFLGMSGTILDPEVLEQDLLAYDLPMPPPAYKRLESTFPLANRPIFYKPVCNLRAKVMEAELPKLLDEVNNILMKYPDVKVLVHTVNWEIRRYLMSQLFAQDRLMTHETENRNEMLEAFKNDPEPRVMISPSFDRGVDLEGDLCRCIIICKMPYLSLGDKQVQQRLKLPGGQSWYNLRALQTLIQMSGRGVRSFTDACDTFILDGQFGNLWSRTRAIMPKWWQDAIQMQSVASKPKEGELF